MSFLLRRIISAWPSISDFCRPTAVFPKHCWETQIEIWNVYLLKIWKKRGKMLTSGITDFLNPLLPLLLTGAWIWCFEHAAQMKQPLKAHFIGGIIQCSFPLPENCPCSCLKNTSQSLQDVSTNQIVPTYPDKLDSTDKSGTHIKNKRGRQWKALCDSNSY